MRSRLPKVAHAVGGLPMLEHVLRAAGDAISSSAASSIEPGADAEDHSFRFVVVLGHEREQVRAAVSYAPLKGDLIYVEQEPQLGTGDAARYARDFLRASNPAPTTILVLYGDTPLVRAQTLRVILDEHH